MNQPVKHHYVPQFILKRFCDQEGKLHSYNKIHEKVSKRAFSPAGVCYGKKLYTLFHAGEMHNDIEDFYSKIEGQISNLFVLVDDQGPSALAGMEDARKVVAAFLSLSFWRLPTSVSKARDAQRILRKIYEEALPESKEELFWDRRLARMLERGKGSNCAKLVQFFYLPALLMHYNNTALAACAFHEMNFDLITSDNPMVCELDGRGGFKGDIYLPVGSRLCITNAPERVEFFQEQIFRQSKSMVMACSNIPLERLAGTAKT